MSKLSKKNKTKKQKGGSCKKQRGGALNNQEIKQLETMINDFINSENLETFNMALFLSMVSNCSDEQMEELKAMVKVSNNGNNANTKMKKEKLYNAVIQTVLC